MKLSKRKDLYQKRKRGVQYKLQSRNRNHYPRIVFRCSLKHLYAQLVDDTKHKTLFTVSTSSKAFAEKGTITYSNKKFAVKLASLFCESLKKHKIKNRFIFDRGGKSYSGKVKVFAEELRKYNLVF